MYADVSLKEFGEFKIYSHCPKLIALAILDYAYTPIEEREEEKKYRLKMPFINDEDESYLNFVRNRNGWLLSDERDDLENYKTQFTQKEIDEMPFDTKFFDKVEVNE
jgi:hypothetical protein